MDLLGNGTIKHIEDHGTVVVVWSEDDGVESIAYLDQGQFQDLVDAYGEELTKEAFLHDGKVIGIKKGEVGEIAASMECLSCGITYPAERILSKCEIDLCIDEECDHRTECGLCLLMRMPPGTSLNMDALLDLL